jgi:hypothetical protein
MQESYIGILVELISGDKVYREDNLDVPLFSLLDESSDLLGSSLVEKGIANLR